jgi:soluble lytic murein transglycosylase-like protein
MRTGGIAMAAAAVLALGAGAAGAQPAAPQSGAVPAGPAIHALSSDDAQAYARAFKAVRAGDFGAVRSVADAVDDECLMGRLQLAKLMHPDYPATYDELRAWLKKYHDQPGADRVYTLARKKAPGLADLPAPDTDAVDASTPDPNAPSWARVEAVAETLDLKAPTTKVDPRLQAAKEAYYGGDLEHGYSLASAAGERWIAGLAAFRMKKYTVAETRLSSLAVDQTQSEWVRSAAAFWAARAAVAAGEPEHAPALLQIAAKTPYTFYGLIAERQLGLDPAISAGGFDMGDTPGDGGAQSAPAASLASGLGRLVKSDKRAHRAAALAQIGLRYEAGQELRTALMSAGSAGARRQWLSLGLALNVPLTSAADLTRSGHSRFDLAQFPTPDLEPVGGFTLDRALIYAIVRQESGFHSTATSNANAFGLMQLTPATAARVVGDDTLAKDPSPLADPAFNLRVGQDYVVKLLDLVKGDVLRAVAAYNSGPGVIMKTAKQMEPEADSLLVFESMPGGQTREFVQRVVSNYWIYRQMAGQDCPSLAALASGARSVTVDP